MDAEYVTKKAISLLKQLHGITFITTEFGGVYRDERPDALLFNSGGTYLIETKVTRTDFLNDAKKKFRADPTKGVGRYRYYACPEGLIAPEELPDRWGLIYVRDGNKRAYMHIGHGGTIKIKTIPCPIHGWSQDIGEKHGSPYPAVEEFWKHPDYPANKFAFNDRCLHTEWSYMYALCARLREGKFLQNIWITDNEEKEPCPS